MQAIQAGQMATQTEIPQGSNDSSGPEKRFNAGAVCATVWKNERQKPTGESFTTFSISLERRYKDQSGSWKSAGSFRLQDLPKAELVLKEAYKYLTLKGEQEVTE